MKVFISKSYYQTLYQIQHFHNLVKVVAHIEVRWQSFYIKKTFFKLCIITKKKFENYVYLCIKQSYYHIEQIVFSYQIMLMKSHC
jgi:hypothetical protein